MAETGFETSDNLRVVKWTAKTWKYAQSNTFFGKFIGKFDIHPNDTGDGLVVSNSPNSICHVRMDLSKGPGDKVWFPLRVPLSGAGRTGEDDLEGHEEELTYDDWSMELVDIANAVKIRGRLSEKRVAMNVKKDAKIALIEWMGRKIDEYSLQALCGLPSDDSNISEVIPDVVATTSSHRVIGGQNSAGSTVNFAPGTQTLANLDETNYLFGPQFLDACVRHAKTLAPKLRPITVKGEDWYVGLIHPLQTKAMRASTDWKSAQENAARRGGSNPIFTGAIAAWGGVVLHEWERLPYRVAGEKFNTNDTVLGSSDEAARGLLLGAQAVCHAYGVVPRMLGKDFDYGRKWGVGIDCLLAVGKPRFDSRDYGVIVMDTGVKPD